MLARALVVTSLVVSTAKADSVQKPGCGEPKAATTKPRTVRDVDWCNFRFPLWKSSMRAGRSEIHLYADIGEAHDTIAYKLTGLVYADFDHDRILDVGAIIEKHTWIGRTGEHHHGGSDIYVYTLRRGAPVSRGSMPTGTPVHGVTVRRGTIVITSGPDRSTQTMRYRRAKNDFEALKAAR